LTKAQRYLLDVNVLIALLSEDHLHHEVAKNWFRTPGLQWATCPFSEAGFLRYMARPTTKGFSVEQATKFRQVPGYHYQPVSADWETLTTRFFHRIFGHNQITDAYLLGLAVRENLVLVTFDRALVHLAGEFEQHVLLLEAT
jgi:toxin-antitoxin system PIN domain toxin